MPTAEWWNQAERYAERRYRYGRLRLRIAVLAGAAVSIACAIVSLACLMSSDPDTQHQGIAAGIGAVVYASIFAGFVSRAAHRGPEGAERRATVGTWWVVLVFAAALVAGMGIVEIAHGHARTGYGYIGIAAACVAITAVTTVFRR